MKRLSHKEVSSRGGKSTAKKLGKEGLSEKGRKMALVRWAKIKNNEKVSTLQPSNPKAE